MKSLKVSITLCLCLALSGLCAVSVSAQKKNDRPETVAPASPTPFSEVKRDSLLNGLQIVSLERSHNGRLRCDLIVHSGAMFDLVYKTGLARLTQETLLAANPNLVSELESLQAEMEWGVTLDYSWFRIESATSTFDTVLEIVGRLLVTENISQEAFRHTQQSQIEKLKNMSAPTPALRADAKFLAELYGAHPYNHDVDGSEQTVANIVWADVYDFYKRFYLPNNTVAVITGEVRRDRAVNIFKAFLGGWVKGKIIPMTFRQPEQAAELRLIKVEDPALTTVELRGGVVGLKQTDQDFIATTLLARVLEARLKKEHKDLAGSFSVLAVPRALPGPFYISASLPAERAAEFSRKATDSFVALANLPATAEELAAAKTSLTTEYAARSVEDQLREIETFSLPRNFGLTYASRVNAITAEDLQKVARRLLNANALTVVVLGKVTEQAKSQLQN